MKMGQDSEQAAEFVMTVRTEHVAMKTWFNESDSAASLRERYGVYPGLWKEVLNWPGWKEARREYLRHTQMAEQAHLEGNGNDGHENASESAPRKRKSRWGSSADGDSAKRNSRWGVPAPSATIQEPPTLQQLPLPPSDQPTGMLPLPSPLNATAPLPVLPLPGVAIASSLPPEKQDQMKHLQGLLRTINEKLETVDQEAARVDALPHGHPDRSPSPPPVYGPDGKRKNTRSVRWREKYTAERQDILEKIMYLNPNPHARKTMSNLLVRKRTKKIPIPIEKHPNYNFIGLIIGPRGKTQKELEAKTGCKIAIRGKGSVKEGARGRRDGKVMEGDNEPLHVVISGDDQRAVDAAADMIEQMLVVIDDEKNVHKQQQLRELALLNGTLKEDEYCTICAEKGHRSFECPRRLARNQNRPVVRCAICGDSSHPTRDCTQKIGVADPKNQQEIDSEYQSFMAELDGKKIEKPASDPPLSSLPSATVTPVCVPAAPTNAPAPPVTTGMPSSTMAPTGSMVGVNIPPPPPPPPPPVMGVHPGLSGSLPGLPPHQPPPSQLQSTTITGTSGSHHGYYGHQQQQQYQRHPHQAPYGGGEYGRPAAPTGYGQQQGAGGYAAQGYGQASTPQVKPGEETSGWDPTSYYGYGAQGGGAGGFNWWEK